MNTTSATLLEKLRLPGQDSAWGRFVDLYTPLLFHWASRLGLKPHEATDVVQEVFIVCLEELPDFRRQRAGSFRRWLWNVVVNKWRERRRSKATPGIDVASVEQHPDAVETLIETEYRNHVVQRALALMKSDFEVNTWKAFWKHRVEQLPAAEVGRELAMTAGAVRVAATRVLQRLRQELQGLVD